MADKTITITSPTIWQYMDVWDEEIQDMTGWGWHESSEAGSSYGSLVQISALNIKAAKIKSISFFVTPSGTQGEGGAGNRYYACGYTTQKGEPSSTSSVTVYLEWDDQTEFEMPILPDISLSAVWYIYFAWTGPRYYPGVFTVERITITYEADKTIKYGYNGGWVECIPYYGYGGKWVQCEPYYGTGSNWVSCSGG